MSAPRRLSRPTECLAIGDGGFAAPQYPSAHVGMSENRRPQSIQTLVPRRSALSLRSIAVRNFHARLW